MELNYNSFSAKLYRFYHGNGMPTNLCPYFWKLVLVYLSVIPLTLLALPTLIVNTCDGYYQFKNYGSLPFKAVSGVIYYFLMGTVLSLLFTLGSIPFGYIYLNDEGITFLGMIQAVGAAVILTAIITFTIWSIITIIEMIPDRRYNRKYNDHYQAPNIVIEFIKAKYNKYCPQIQWVDTKQLENE